MLHFLKKRSYLKDLIPANYIDIHSHLLPGIDDGSDNISTTLSLVKALEQIGFSQFITTPHIMEHVWNNTPEIITRKLEETQNAFKEEKKDTNIRAAAEYLIDSNFPELFREKELLTLKENYVLVEMSYLNPPINLYEILFELQLEGYKPVLAHPERYNFYHGRLEEYKKLKNAGCVFQINLLSSVGYYGKQVAQVAEYLLKNGMIDFAGSDVHHSKHIDSFESRIILKSSASLETALLNNSFFQI